MGGALAERISSPALLFLSDFVLELMFVHRCDRCCVYVKEMQSYRTKYRGIWAILMHKMMFPSESCNSVSNGTFCEFLPFSVIAEIFSPRTPCTTLRTPGAPRTTA